MFSLLRDVHLEPHVARGPQRIEVGVRREEAVEDVAPDAPFTADVDDDALALRLRLRERGGEILLRIALRVEPLGERLRLRDRREGERTEQGECPAAFALHAFINDDAAVRQ